jgi:type 1 glutamine amidotransferase
MRIVALLGDYWHEENMIKHALKEAIGSVPQLSVDYIQYSDLKNALKTKPDAVILFKENRLNPLAETPTNWMDERAASAITDYVKNGGGWLAWHTGMAEYPTHSEYIDMLKGYFRHHPDMKSVTYQMKDGLSFTITDEHYFVSCKEEETEVFLTSESADGKSIAGWSHPYGSGRVCCLTPAHTAEGLKSEQLQKILRDRILWCLEG